ncbi:MAG: hypothetical protein JXA99_13595 [Candidatus Lokiarchaeota archaeon]|nr:hypothetical protein [Candidatus Lokiarchaeota archaeon]
MKKNNKIAFVGLMILVIAISSFPTMSLGASDTEYYLGIKEGDTFYYEVTTNTINGSLQENTMWGDFRIMRENFLKGRIYKITLEKIQEIDYKWDFEWSGNFFINKSITTDLRKNPDWDSRPPILLCPIPINASIPINKYIEEVMYNMAFGFGPLFLSPLENEFGLVLANFITNEDDDLIIDGYFEIRFDQEIGIMKEFSFYQFVDDEKIMTFQLKMSSDIIINKITTGKEINWFEKKFILFNSNQNVGLIAWNILNPTEFEGYYELDLNHNMIIRKKCNSLIVLTFPLTLSGLFNVEIRIYSLQNELIYQDSFILVIFE